MPPRRPRRDGAAFVWSCCRCGVGPTHIHVAQCPACRVERCARCRTEKIVRGRRTERPRIVAAAPTPPTTRVWRCCECRNKYTSTSPESDTFCPHCTHASCTRCFKCPSVEQQGGRSHQVHQGELPSRPRALTPVSYSLRTVRNPEMLLLRILDHFRQSAFDCATVSERRRSEQSPSTNTAAQSHRSTATLDGGESTAVTTGVVAATSSIPAATTHRRPSPGSQRRHELDEVGSDVAAAEPLQDSKVNMCVSNANSTLPLEVPRTLERHQDRGGDVPPSDAGTLSNPSNINNSNLVGRESSVVSSAYPTLSQGVLPMMHPSLVRSATTLLTGVPSSISRFSTSALSNMERGQFLGTRSAHLQALEVSDSNNDHNYARAALREVRNHPIVTGFGVLGAIAGLGAWISQMKNNK